MYERENSMCGHDESVNSLNKGMYLEALQFLRDYNDEICAIGNDVFSLLVDESSDVVKKEQMVVVLSYKDKVTKEQAICVGEGKNQEVTLARDKDTRWGSHHRTIISLIKMFLEVLKVLHYVEKEGLTNTLSRDLQKSDQIILEAVLLVKGTKRSLQEYRATCFASLLKNLTLFCSKHDIEMICKFKSLEIVLVREAPVYLILLAALSPHASFLEFSVSKLVKLDEMYPRDFTYKERLSLLIELELYYQIMRNDKDFANSLSIAKLAEKMVDKKKHTSHPLVYQLALVLPVAIAMVDIFFF
ncbi:zinc finger MYM-type protein 1-like protein [Tanacetum coccineum]